MIKGVAKRRERWKFDKCAEQSRVRRVAVNAGNLGRHGSDRCRDTLNLLRPVARLAPTAQALVLHRRICILMQPVGGCPGLDLYLARCSIYVSALPFVRPYF